MSRSSFRDEPAEIQPSPRRADDGEPRLSIDGRWQVRLLDPFGIDGPPGDAPANDTLIYTCYLVFEPA